MFNEILVGRFNKALNSVFGIKAGAPSPSVSGDVMPTWALDYAVDSRYLEGWSRYAASNSIPAAVGNSPIFQLLNPAASGVIAVIELYRWTLQNNAAVQRVKVGHGVLGQIAGLGAVVVNALDSRQNSGPVATTAGTLKAFDGSVAGPVFPGQQVIDDMTIDINAGTFVYIPSNDRNQEIPMLPGDSFTIGQGLVVNAPMSYQVWWRERVLEDSEKR